MLLARQKLHSGGAAAANGSAVDLGGDLADVTIHLTTSNATVSAGDLTIEHAPTTDYAGTWQAIGSAITPVQNSAQTIQFRGSFLAVRARISTAVTGGATVTVELTAAVPGE